MKKAASICLASVICGLVFAADMEGEYNTWLGYIAGINSDGNRTTVQGAGAGGEATGLIRTDLIGAASGAYSANLTDCVGIGFRSLLYSTNMKSVVAIGTDAFTNRNGLTKATYINGQFAAFAQNNTFWLKPNPEMDDTNAPIHYANGVLSLNAETVRINGETTSGGVADSTQTILDGYDLYVDPVAGDDAYDGLTRYTPKRTIDGAYASVTNHDMTICLMAGEHKSPSGAGSDGNTYPPYRVHYIGLYGKKNTIIDGDGERVFFGCNYGIASVEGCTLRNFRGKVNRPRIFFMYLYDCDVDLTGGTSGYGFAGCVVEKCNISGITYFATDPSRIFSGLFMQCDVFDSVIDITPTEKIGCTPSLFYATYLENVFMLVRGAVRNFGAASDSEKSVLGNPISMLDCTVICEQSVNSFNVPPATGCLFGLGDITNSIPTYSTVTGSVCTNAAAVLAAIQSDYRPPVSEWRFRFHGYESASDRAVKNSMENSIIDALLKNDEFNLTQTAQMNLMRTIARNESIDAPRTANRSTNAAPEKLEIKLPEEEEPTEE